MNKVYEPLFTPWKIRNVEIKNRIVLTSMGGTSIFGWMEPCHFDKEAANFLLERAKNNVGLILPGIAPVRDPMLGRWLYTNKGMFKKLSKWMPEFHKTGAKLFIQLTAGFGRSFAVNEVMEKLVTNPVLKVLSKPMLDVEYLCAAPSVLPNRWSDKVPSKELSVKQIDKIILGFAKTAKLCKDAGVDGVEVHAVHEGYLLDQFTLKYCNNRTDDYGGSFENRYRLPVQIVKAIKALCGEDFPVSLRYSVVSKTKGFRQGALPGEDYVEVGRDMAESEKAAKYLQDAGYDMLNCDNGTYDAWYWAHPPGYMPQNCNLEDVEHIKKFVDIPVVCAGRMSPEVAAESIKAGKLDGMGVARQFLADPEWVTKLMEDRMEDIRPCICCHNGCFTMAHYEGTSNDQDLQDAIHMARCAINPETMQTTKFYIKPAKKIKKVAIIGGGVGGMEAARVLTLRGHKVQIFEKSNGLGGIFVAAAAPSFKEKDRELLAWYELEMKKLNVNIAFNHEVISLDELKDFDEVIVATGSKAITPRNIKGHEKAVQAVDYLLDNSKVGENVVIVGGGLTGCEIAYDLYLQGKKPTIVEFAQDLIVKKGICLANTSFLRDFFKLNKVPVLLNTGAKEIRDGEIVVASREGGKEQVIKCDNVILSIGYKPTPLFENSKHVHVIGDAAGIGNLRTVIWAAYKLAMKL